MMIEGCERGILRFRDSITSDLIQVFTKAQASVSGIQYPDRVY